MSYSQVLPEYVGRNKRNAHWRNAHEIVHMTRNWGSIGGLLKHLGQKESYSGDCRLLLTHLGLYMDFLEHLDNASGQPAHFL